MWTVTREVTAYVNDCGQISTKILVCQRTGAISLHQLIL